MKKRRTQKDFRERVRCKVCGAIVFANRSVAGGNALYPLRHINRDHAEPCVGTSDPHDSRDVVSPLELYRSRYGRQNSPAP